MDHLGLVAIQPRSFKPRTTDSRHTLGYNPNLLLDAAPPDGINQLWVGDITYVPLLGGNFLYLALLMDRYSRSIVGWDMQEHMRIAGFSRFAGGHRSSPASARLDASH